MTANVDTAPDWNKLVRLFKPGNGVMPPKLAGREKPLKSLQGLLDCLVNYEPASRDVVLYGPRGNGKTVLLAHFERGARQAQVDVLSLRPTRLRNEAELAYQLLYQDTHKWGKALLSEAARLLPAGANLTSPDGTRVGLTWQRMSQAEKNEHARAHLPALLSARCKDKPLLVTLDEAHTLDLEVGQTLLNTSEEVRKAGGSFLLALSGTPGLRDHLGKMNATFWGRSEKLAIGRLSDPAARESLEAPLSKLSVTFDANALASVVNESQRYPYFIQVWGKALCEALVEQGGQHIDAAIVTAARPGFEAERTDYYADRYREIRTEGLLDAAVIVARAFRPEDDDPPPRCREEDLEALLCEALGLPPGVKQPGAEAQVAAGTALHALRRLTHLGFLWTPYGKNRLEPGIPSLMTYVLAEASPASAPAPVAAPGPA